MQKLPFSISILTEKSTNYTYLITKYFPNIPHESNWFTYDSVLEVVQGQKINPDITVAEMKGDFEKLIQSFFKERHKIRFLSYLRRMKRSWLIKSKRLH